MKKAIANLLSWFQKYYFHILILVGILVFIVFYNVFKLGEILNMFEFSLYDYRTRVYIQTFAKNPDKDIVLLIHNDQSNKLINSYPELGLKKWPLQRGTWKYILRFLRRANNKLTVYDVKFTARSEDPVEDEILIKEIKKSGNVILAYIMQSSAIGFVEEYPQFNLNTLEKFNDFLQYKTNFPEQLIEYFYRSFVTIPKQNYEQLNYNTILYITFLSAQGILEDILKAPLDLGIINMSHAESSTEVTRVNKPLWRYRYQDKFGLSLPLVTAKNVLIKNNGNKLSFSTGLLGDYLNLGNRKLALNEFGDIYINWRANDHTNSVWKNKPYAFKTFPLASVLAYERFYTFDSYSGYYNVPEEFPYRNWDSNYNVLIKNSLVEANINYLQQYYDYIKVFDIEYSSSFKQTLVLVIESLKKVFNFQAKNLMWLKSVTEGMPLTYYTYEDNLQNIILSDHYYGFSDDIYNPRTRYKIMGLPFLYYFDEDQPPKRLSGFNFRDDEKYLILQRLDKFQDQYPDISAFFNNIVIIGESTATGDVHSTPVCKAYPGPEIVATAMDNYLNDGSKNISIVENISNWIKSGFKLDLAFTNTKMIRKVPMWLDIIVILLLCFITSYTIIKSKSYISSANLFLIIYAFFIALNVAMFTLPFVRLWFNAIIPLLLIPVTALLTMVYRVKVLDKDKHHIKTLFGKFVSPQILEAVLDNPELLSAGASRKKEMTVLFSDIRDFTSKSEHVPPEELIPQLNEYFTEMVEVIIMKYNGTLDKYMGDAIMAFWGDPIPMEDHAKNAVLAALSMCKHLELLNEKWEKEGKPPLRIGVGINSGEMIVGHMGSPRLIDYTVLGDNVNVASRVESLNKAYGKEIIITEATYEFVKDIIEVEQLGTTSVKGRTKEVVIYSVEGLKDGVEVNFDRTPKLFVEKEQT
ncbi:MAG: adenylate/guanylate cyclase domain-containing protein [Cyanobacteriota bacterium]